MGETDREMLELAAKAAGLEGLTWRNGSACFYYDDPETGREEWNPLCKDGQALRLAVKLQIEVRNFNGKSHAGRQGEFWCTENWFPDGDACATTRRAITRAAAEIGAQQGKGEGS